ncbi:hypothetical protein MKSMC1_13920 [Mycobacterium kansasii]|nr:hypothetical protein MKSMC1_13920 [Mycobacterium kansasii]
MTVFRCNEIVAESAHQVPPECSWVLFLWSLGRLWVTMLSKTI